MLPKDEQQHPGKAHHAQHNEGGDNEVEGVSALTGGQENSYVEGLVGQDEEEIKQGDSREKKGIHGHLVKCARNGFHAFSEG